MNVIVQFGFSLAASCWLTKPWPNYGHMQLSFFCYHFILFSSAAVPYIMPCHRPF